MPQQQIIQHITSNRCYLREDAKIVFVCGRDVNAENSKRKIFLDYAARHIQDAHFLLAEDVFKVDDNDHGDLLSIEERLATYSDCIIVILESESAFAELGAFAIKNELCKLIIPVNDEVHRSSSSFINLGPLNKISGSKEGFGATIYTNMETFSNCFPEIQNRLKKIILSRRKKIKIDTYQLFVNSNKERVLLIHDIIKVLAPVKLKELINLFKATYGETLRFDLIRLDIKLLEALRLVGQSEGYYMASDSKNSFVDFGFDSFTSLKTKQLMLYKRYYPERLTILGKVAQNATAT